LSEVILEMDNIIKKFENPTSGSVLIEGKHVENTQPNERNVNTVFQNMHYFHI